MTVRVLLDCDGVLADFMTPALKTMNRILGTSKRLEDMKSWHLFDAFEPDVTVTSKQREECYSEWKTAGWCTRLEPLPNTRWAIDQLRQLGAEVIVVTSPMDGATWVHERDHWLRRHFQFDRDSIIHTNAKHAVAGDIFVDDKTEHCTTWQRCHPTGKAIRWSTYTNHYIPWNDGLTTDDWNDVIAATQLADNKKDQRTWTHRSI